MSVKEQYEEYMKEALLEARLAMEKEEIPVGAVVVKDGVIIGRGHNLRETNFDPTAHAEIIAMRKAAEKLGGWRLSGCTVYVTLEPCPMCAGAMLQSRIDKVVYGADDLKAGSAGSQINILQFPGFNHQVKIVGGILKDESVSILQEFFQERRNKI